jgi:hypothetical protein
VWSIALADLSTDFSRLFTCLSFKLKEKHKERSLTQLAHDSLPAAHQIGIETDGTSLKVEYNRRQTKRLEETQCLVGTSCT